MSRNFYNAPPPKNEAKRNSSVTRAVDLLRCSDINMPTKDSTSQEAEEVIKVLYTSIQSYYLARLSAEEVRQHFKESSGRPKESVALIKARMDKEQREEHKAGVDELRKKYPWLKTGNSNPNPKPSPNQIRQNHSVYLIYMLKCLEAWEEVFGG